MIFDVYTYVGNCPDPVSMFVSAENRVEVYDALVHEFGEEEADSYYIMPCPGRFAACNRRIVRVKNGRFVEGEHERDNQRRPVVGRGNCRRR
jgi:hypothetical protein